MDLFVAALRKPFVGAADREERKRLARAHHPIRHGGEILHRGGRSHRHGEDDDGGPRRADRTHRGTRRVPGGGTVVAQDHRASRRALRAAAEEDALLAAEFGELPIAHLVEGGGAEARGEQAADEGAVEIGAAVAIARGDGAEGHFLVAGDAELASRNRVEGEAEFACHRGGDRNAPTGQPEDHRVGKAGHGGSQGAREHTASLSAVGVAAIPGGAVLLRRGHNLSIVDGVNHRGGDELRRRLEHAAELRAAQTGENDPELSEEERAEAHRQEELRKKRLRFDSARRADYLVRDAMARGDFDNLKYAGKPIPGLGGTHDPDWWIKGLIQREHLTGLGPKAILLRVEDGQLDERLDALFTEKEVRDALEDFNARVIDARRQLEGGPPVVTKTRDVDGEVQRWRERREERTAAARQAEEVAAAEAELLRSRRPWWQRLWRGQS